jgi:opacity protein-like surface antigen
LLPTAVATLAAVFAAASVAAQTPPPARPGIVRPDQPPIGLRAYGFMDSTTMTASESFEATLGSKTMRGIGGGFEVLRLWEGVFARLNYSTAKRTGERVIVFEGEAISLGIPMAVEITPLEAGAGWRSDFGRRRIVGFYGGGSLVRMRYRQTSDFAERDEDIDDTFTGYAVFGGLDVTIASWVMIGAEAQYGWVPNGLGQSGASQAFGETDLGGRSFRVMVGIKR